MNTILGMDIWVFIAWILTIISALICVLYGVYNWFFTKNKNNNNTKKKSIKKEDN